MVSFNLKSFKRLLRFLYLKLVRINDTPCKVSLGFGIGVFSGILPGTGPIAALFLAFLLRVNRLAALLGSLLTNSWLSIVTFLLSIKLGSAIMGLDWRSLQEEWRGLLKDFQFSGLFKLSILKIILPVVIGYLTIAIVLGAIVYLVTLVIFTQIRHAHKSRVDFSP